MTESKQGRLASAAAWVKEGIDQRRARRSESSGDDADGNSDAEPGETPKSGTQEPGNGPQEPRENDRDSKEKNQKRPDPYGEAVAEYNNVFSSLSERGRSLFHERERSVDVIELVELMVNSIANTPKSFDTDFEEITAHRLEFRAAADFARDELTAARRSAGTASGGAAAGAAVAAMAPSAAMWVATAFGTASTGTAISTLSGAAATKAALAWLGGGAVATGGGGTAAGTALLALAGPVGWGIAGATLLTSITLLARRTAKNRKAKQEAITAVKRNAAALRGTDTKLADLLERTTSLRERLMGHYKDALPLFAANFTAVANEDRSRLGALVNNTKACAALLAHQIEQETDDRG